MTRSILLLLWMRGGCLADEEAGALAHAALHAKFSLGALEGNYTALARALPVLPMAGKAALLGKDIFVDNFREHRRRDSDANGDLSFEELWAEIGEFNGYEAEVEACYAACVAEGRKSASDESPSAIQAQSCTPLGYTLMRLNFDGACLPIDWSELDAYWNAVMERADEEDRIGDPSLLGLQVDENGIIIDGNSGDGGG